MLRWKRLSQSNLEGVAPEALPSLLDEGGALGLDVGKVALSTSAHWRCDCHARRRLDSLEGVRLRHRLVGLGRGCLAVTHGRRLGHRLVGLGRHCLAIS